LEFLGIKISFHIQIFYWEFLDPEEPRKKSVEKPGRSLSHPVSQKPERKGGETIGFSNQN
jgi:hypothetical protein